MSSSVTVDPATGRLRTKNPDWSRRSDRGTWRRKNRGRNTATYIGDNLRSRHTHTVLRQEHELLCQFFEEEARELVTIQKRRTEREARRRGDAWVTHMQPHWEYTAEVERVRPVMAEARRLRGAAMQLKEQGQSTSNVDKQQDMFEQAEDLLHKAEVLERGLPPVVPVYRGQVDDEWNDEVIRYTYATHKDNMDAVYEHAIDRQFKATTEFRARWGMPPFIQTVNGEDLLAWGVVPYGAPSALTTAG